MLAFRLALTFLFSKKRYGIINAITWLAAAVSIFVAAAMIIILSAFNGIQSLVLDLYSSIEAPYSITTTDASTLHITSEQLEKIQNLDGVIATGLRCSGEVIFQFNDTPWYGTLVGTENNLCEVTEIRKHLENTDDCKLGRRDLLLGAGIRYKLRYPKDHAMSPLVVKSLRKDRKINTQTVKNIQSTAFNVRNTFSVNAEYDLKYAFTPLKTAQELLGYEAEEYSSIECNGTEAVLAQKASIESILGVPVHIITEDDRLGDMRKTANIEKWISLLMLCLVLLIAAFNLIAAITMLIIDKRKDLETLEILGMSDKERKRIFSYILLFINLGGAGIGLLLGSIVVWVQEHFGLIKISDSVVEYYPVELQFTDAAIVFGILIVSAFLAQFPVQWVSKRIA